MKMDPLDWSIVALLCSAAILVSSLAALIFAQALLCVY